MGKPVLCKYRLVTPDGVFVVVFQRPIEHLCKVRHWADDKTRVEELHRRGIRASHEATTIPLFAALFSPCCFATIHIGLPKSTFEVFPPSKPFCPGRHWRYLVAVLLPASQLSTENHSRAAQAHDFLVCMLEVPRIATTPYDVRPIYESCELLPISLEKPVLEVLLHDLHLGLVTIPLLPLAKIDDFCVETLAEVTDLHEDWVPPCLCSDEGDLACQSPRCGGRGECRSRR
mmetsp:Transcript_115920/g.322782  ORF Transcript_115920/g.322782 Transcript_115920/m.322782 type:complete len:231 (-) Transcript_115920:227-919(-)